MKKILITAAVLLAALAVSGQRTVTLWECYDSAAATTPLALEVALYTEISELKDRNLSAAYLPALDLNGSALYNSDVVDMSDMLGSLPIPPGSLPSIPHEQYKATFDVSQVIWDGGVTRNARAVEQVVKELNMQQNEADIYRLREQINNYYFLIMLTSSQAEVVEILITELDAKIRDTQSGVSNGVISAVTLDVLEAEKIKATQSLIEMKYRKAALIKALEQMTGIKDLEGAVLSMPEPVIADDIVSDHPDLRLFDIRNHQLEVSKSLLKSQRMPKAFAFAQLGYGNPPGSNFLSDKADVYYSMGAGLKWNIFDWNRNSNERQSLTIQQQLIDIKKSVTTESLQRMLTIKKSEIASLREAAVSDADLISIRKKIVSAAASQLENGTITASQYLTELNSEKQAVISASIRQISIARAEVEYMNITGKNK